MLDDFNVDLVKGQAKHRPTGHVFMFDPNQAPDLVLVKGWRQGERSHPAADELAVEALHAIRRAMRYTNQSPRPRTTDPA